MENLEFKKASEKQQSSLKSFGTVANAIGTNGIVKPVNAIRALEEQACALKVELTLENGDYLDATCSRKVMKDLWDKTLKYEDLKFLDIIETLADKTVLNPITNLYEKVLDEQGNVVKEPLLTLGYAGTDTSALNIKINAKDLAELENSKRTVDWSNLIAL
jgi:hypothetical protein